MPFIEQTEVKLEIGPLRITVPLGTIPPGDIRLWEENPRTKHLVAQFDAYPTQDDLRACVEQAQPQKFKDLRADIAKFGQQEPVFLRGDRSTDPIEVATVIEGNTRVAILQSLHDRDPKDPRFGVVRAYLLPRDFSDNELAILMATFHVKGTMRNPWDRYQIGAFLYDQVEKRSAFTQAELAEDIGKSQGWVSHHITIFKFALEFRDELENKYNVSAGALEEQVNRYFSILEEAYKVKAFRDEWARDIAAKETLFRWIHEGKFKDHRSVRAIHEIYNDPIRRQQVENGELGSGDAAADRLGKTLPLHEDLDRIVKRVEAIQLGDLQSIDRKKLTRVRQALEGLEAMLDRIAIGA